MTSRWHVLCCKPHKEQLILRQLQNMGYEAYFPCFISPTSKIGSLELKPYFPGYLFVKVDLIKVGVSTFQWMPNTDGLVCFETRPAFVPDPLIHAVRRHVDQLNQIQVSRSQGGPFQIRPIQDDPIQSTPSQDKPSDWEGQPEAESNGTGYEALFDRQVSSSERINSLLHLLEIPRLPPASSEA